MKFHPTALIESDQIGEGTRIWAYAHVLSGARIGRNVNIGDHAFVEGGAIVGDNVTIKNQVLIWDGVTIEDDVFIGPRVTFTNDRHPRSPRMAAVRPRYASRDNWLAPTIVRRGCSIGAGATICPGLEIGAFSMVGAGAVVTRSVEPFSLVTGTPARKIGDVCTCGQRLDGLFDDVACTHCGQDARQRLSLLGPESVMNAT